MASPTPTSLEERVAALEQAMAHLLRSEPNGPRFKDWRRAVGMFAGNELQREIDAAGAEIRAADRQESGS